MDYDPIKSFVNDDGSKQFEFTVDGNPLKSRYGNINCVYYEASVIYYTEENRNMPEKYSTWSDVIHSTNPFSILVAGKHKIEIIPDSTLRLFLLPTFEKQFTKSNAPDSLKSIFEGDSHLVLGKQIDFCLQQDKKYYGYVRKEDREYGPPNESGDRASSTYYFFQISDKPFIDDKPQLPETPTFRGWIYS